MVRLKSNHPVRPYLPVWVCLVLDIQIFERGDERLSLEASGGSRGDRRVADGALCADGDDVAPQRGSKVTRLVSSLSNAAHVEAAAEINAVQNLRGDSRGTDET